MQVSCQRRDELEGVTPGIYWLPQEAEWRGYDGALGRFTQPDSIVPTGTQGTQAWDRYAFVNNNPVRYNDPTGHMMDEGEGGGCSNPVNGRCPAPQPTKPPTAASGSKSPYRSTATATINPTLSSWFTRTPTPRTILVPGPTSTPTITPTSTHAPMSTINPDHIAKGLEIGGIAADASTVGGEAAPPLVGIAISGITQLVANSNDNYTPLQEVARVGTSIFEGVITGGVAGLAGGGIFIGLGGPANPLAYVGGVVGAGGTAYSMNRLFDNVNQLYINPWIAQLP